MQGERERETEREREREKERERERDRKREKESERERKRESKRERERECGGGFNDNMQSPAAEINDVAYTNFTRERGVCLWQRRVGRRWSARTEARRSADSAVFPSHTINSKAFLVRERCAKIREMNTDLKRG